MASGEQSSHPCHNLSNPSKRLFWCRHCMTKFIDPIQRWRHSKTCKKIVSSNPRQEIESTDGRRLQVMAGTTEGSVMVSNQASLENTEPSKRKIRKLVMNNLKCMICDRDFISLDDMREHVKQPCRKYVPFEDHVLIPIMDGALALPPLEEHSKQQNDDVIEKASALNSLEANLQQMEQSLAMRSDVADDVVANQIESLLKAAQVLQQQQQLQQQEQQATTYQLLTGDLGDGDTQYIITTNPEHYEDGQFEAVTVETVATVENSVPQVAMCPEGVAHQVILQPCAEPDDLQLISEVIAREEPEIGTHRSFVPPSCRSSSSSSSSVTSAVDSQDKQCDSVDKDSGICNDDDSVSDRINSNTKSFSDGSKSTSDSQDFSDNDSNSTDNVSNCINNVSNCTDNVSNSIDNFSNSTENISSSTENVSNCTDNVSNSTDEVSNSTDKVSNSTDNVSNSTDNVSNGTDNGSVSKANVLYSTDNVLSSMDNVSNITDRVSCSADNVSNSGDRVNSADRVSNSTDTDIGDCSNQQENHVTEQKSASNCCEFCYDPTLDDFGFRNLLDSGVSQTCEPLPRCTCRVKSTTSYTDEPDADRKPSKYRIHPTAKKMRTRSTSLAEKEPVKNPKKKRRYAGGKGSLDFLARSKRKKVKRVLTNTLCVGKSETVQCSQTDRKDVELLLDQNSVVTNSVDQTSGVMKGGCDVQQGGESCQSENVKVTNTSVCLAKKVAKKPKSLREPKCRICDRVFKNLQLLQKHNKVPCKIKHTRNLCQKVLRPKRAPVVYLPSVKQKPGKTNNLIKKTKSTLLERPQLLAVRRISDTTLFILPKNKKGNKKRRKSAPVFIYTPPVKEYKNTFLGVHMTYESLPFKEKFFFDLGMISSLHLRNVSHDTKVTDSCGSVHQMLSQDSSEEFIDITGPCTPPPILERIPALDSVPLLDPYSVQHLDDIIDLEPPVLEIMICDSATDNLLTESNNNPAPVSKMQKLSPGPPALEMQKAEHVSDQKHADTEENILLSVSEKSASNTLLEVSDEEQVTLSPCGTSLKDSSHDDAGLEQAGQSKDSPPRNRSELVQQKMSEIFIKYFNSPEKQDNQICSSPVKPKESFFEKLTKDSNNQKKKVKQIHEQATDESPLHLLKKESNFKEQVENQQLDSHSVEESWSECVDDVVMCSIVPELDQMEENSEHVLSVVHECTMMEVELQPCDSREVMEQQSAKGHDRHLVCHEVESEQGVGLEITEQLPLAHPAGSVVSLESTGIGLSLQESVDATVPHLHDIIIAKTETSIQMNTHVESPPVENTVLETHIESKAKESSVELNKANDQHQCPGNLSPTKSSTNRHFTDLLADLCSSPSQDGATSQDTLVWSKLTTQSHDSIPPEDQEGSIKTKDSPKSGDRHFMDAIMMETALCKTSVATPGYKGSNGLCKKVHKVTVAVQTDANFTSDKIIYPSFASILDASTPSDSLVTDMVGSETFDATCITNTLPMEISETNDTCTITSVDERICVVSRSRYNKHAEEANSHSNNVDMCSISTCPPAVIHEKVDSVKEICSKECSKSTGGVETLSPDVDQKGSSSKESFQKKHSPTQISKHSPSKTHSTESSPRKGEGRNLFESLFSSLGTDHSDMTGVPKSDQSQGLMDSSPQCKPIEQPTNFTHILQPNNRDIVVYPPDHCKIIHKTLDPSPPEFVGRTKSVPSGLSTETTDKRNRTNLLELVAKSLGIYSDEEQASDNVSCVVQREFLKASASTVVKNDIQPEISEEFVNIPFVQSTSCSDDAEDSSVQIIVVNNQSSCQDYTADINVIDLPSKPTVSSVDNIGGNRFPSVCEQQNKFGLQQTSSSSASPTTTDSMCTTCAGVQCLGAESSKDSPLRSVSECTCNVVAGNTVKQSTSKLKPSTESGVKIVMCGIEDLRKRDNYGVVVTDSSSTCDQQNNFSNQTPCIERGVGSEAQLSESRSNLCNTSAICNTRSEINRRQVERESLDTKSCPTLNISNYSTNNDTLSDITCNSEKSKDLSRTPNLHHTTVVSEADPVTMVTDIHISSVGMEGSGPVTMDTGENDRVPNLASVTTEEVSGYQETWGEPSVMVQYVQDCDQNVSYIVLDSEKGHETEEFMVTDSECLKS